MNPKISDFGLARSFGANESAANTDKVAGWNIVDHHLNLIGHAWRLHIEGRSLELVDASMGNSYDLSELLRLIYMGLLCVQRSPEDRPNMSSMVLMLGSEGSLPQPKQPGFFTERNLVEADSSTSKREQSSTNEITITLLEAQ
ncbi:hypothetical protein L1049_015626 [Liquidambar formosana]|uniref:S-locus receptor kinase C-terminal domain-containing protein n=1 Tax=Liquidambar formosana TaxID=63359 RepID=A0AAP0X691_LIQFO